MSRAGERFRAMARTNRLSRRTAHRHGLRTHRGSLRGREGPPAPARSGRASCRPAVARPPDALAPPRSRRRHGRNGAALPDLDRRPRLRIRARSAAQATVRALGPDGERRCTGACSVMASRACRMSKATSPSARSSSATPSGSSTSTSPKCRLPRASSFSSSVSTEHPSSLSLNSLQLPTERRPGSSCSTCPRPCPTRSTRFLPTMASSSPSNPGTGTPSTPGQCAST